MTPADFDSARWVIELLLLAGATVMWFLVRKLIADLAALEKQVSDHKLHVAENFSTKTDLAKAIEAFNRSIEAVIAKLDRIEDKLDKKADK